MICHSKLKPLVNISKHEYDHNNEHLTREPMDIYSTRAEESHSWYSQVENKLSRFFYPY